MSVMGDGLTSHVCLPTCSAISAASSALEMRGTAATQAAVAAAQEAGQIVEMTSVVPVDVHVAYPQYEQVLRLAQDSCAKVSDTDYADAVTLHLVFKAGEQGAFCAKMRELMAGREEIEVGAPEFAEF